MGMTNFGEAFAAKTLRRFYATAIFPAITNTNYEGQLKAMGDRLNILSFPGDVQLGDYVAGTDMTSFPIYDKEDQLVVEKRKYYNFPIDRLEDLFTYVDDESDALTENAAKTIERAIDSYVLEQAQYGKAGSWIGIDVRIVGSSRDTEASVATTATGGTISVQSPTTSYESTVEHGDGTLDYSGFTAADVGKPIRLTSGTSWATEWYRITGVTSSTVVTVENWDGAVDAMDIPNGDVLRGLYGAFPFTGGAINGDGKPTTEGGWGWEMQAARATSLTATVIYDQITLLAEKLDNNEIPDTDRHLTVPPAVTTMLRQAAELQPAIAMAYEGVILNGRVGRCAGFDIHQASSSRVSTRVEHSTSTGQGSDIVLTTGSQAYMVLGNHISFCTFAYKWAESRVIESESQFAPKYQGLHLWGAKVPGIRRRSGAVLFGKV
jgi:hypothetical protein